MRHFFSLVIIFALFAFAKFHATAAPVEVRAPLSDGPDPEWWGRLQDIDKLGPHAKGPAAATTTSTTASAFTPGVIRDPYKRHDGHEGRAADTGAASVTIASVPSVVIRDPYKRHDGHKGHVADTSASSTTLASASVVIYEPYKRDPRVTPQPMEPY
ncbi:hypothetical protein OE88DRAFT_1668446 [Heliocybe sulcata]|uniref:Uncharacterized protein n=1 Tax=Heliocybe sulcata TaxID=5364 RepID=A0A5C3MMP5_9AGAM|nr:hypothetical protein OE88DRAFT_1668446 [Heliocybe sulcata]